MYPRLVIDLDKLRANLDACARLVKDAGLSLMIVTKGLCADREMVRMVCACPEVDFVADSRLANIKSYAAGARAAGKKTVLLRIPMHCEAAEVVEYVDLSFNSELSTIRLLNEEAGKKGIVHNILLMIDMGDLREGIFYQDEDLIEKAVSKILAMDNIHLYGIGVNLTCYGAIIPKEDNLGGLATLARKIENRFDIKLDMVSGGNSSSIYLIWQGGLPQGINNLRLGESFLLGNDTAYGDTVPGCVHDAITLEAQVIELADKPSLPIGEVGVDAFGQKPCYEDRGIMKRAIIAVGKQDTDPSGMVPLDPDIKIMGGSSDHTILDLTRTSGRYKVGDIVSFTVEYGAMLKLATSPYVEKVYIGKEQG